MNFQFMIYILLGLMLYFYFVVKVKSSIYFIVLLIVLALNEIYNNKKYNRKDLFTSGTELSPDLNYKENYVFDKTLNPMEFSRSELKTAVIPNVIDGDPFLKDGMTCYIEKKIMDEKLKSKKLDYQGAYVQALSDIIFPENGTDNSLDDIIEGTNIKLNFEDDIDPNVFNPIFENKFTVKKKCPTVCHLISDYNECKNATEIPNFQNKSEFNTWKQNTLDKCAKITNRRDCNDSVGCTYDDVYSKCYYDKRKCLAYENENGPQCHTRCEYLNIPMEIQKSKMNCDSAKLYDGTQYCLWNTLRNECSPKCEMYSGEIECNSSNYCEYKNGKCENI